MVRAEEGLARARGRRRREFAFPPSASQDRSEDSDPEDAQDDGQRHGRRDFVDVREDHLPPDEEEDEGEAGLQVGEPAHGPRQEEVEGPQPEDGEDVGGVGYEDVISDGQDGRDRIYGEGQVRSLNGNQCDEEWGGVRHAAELSSPTVNRALPKR